MQPTRRRPSGGSTTSRRSPATPRRWREWRYPGSQERTALYRPSVTVGNGSAPLRLRNASLRTAERELGVTPPGEFAETDHPKEVAWLGERSPAVVVVDGFDSTWSSRLARAVEGGELTVENGNDTATR